MLWNHVTSLFLDPCTELDTDFLGNDIQVNGKWHIPNVKNSLECQLLCQEESSCEFWTYGLTVISGNCHLKTSAGVRKPHRGLISGKKFCGKLNR